MSTEPGSANVDKTHFTVVPPGCSLLNSPWINGLSRLSVVNKWHNILPANFHLSWKRPETTKDRLHALLERIFELRNAARKSSEYNIRFQVWSTQRRRIRTRTVLFKLLEFAGRHFVPPSTNISQAHYLSAYRTPFPGSLILPCSAWWDLAEKPREIWKAPGKAYVASYADIWKIAWRAQRMSA